MFATPDNKDARKLLADTYSQLAYQAESAPYRNFYLTGAKELLETTESKNRPNYNIGRSNIALIPTLFFDVIATRINGYKNDHQSITINIQTTDTNDKVSLILKNGALSNRPDYQLINPDVTVKTDKKSLYDLFSLQVKVSELQSNGKLSIKGDVSALNTLLSLLEQPNRAFNIIEP